MSALICLILFFVLIDHGELHVSQVLILIKLMETVTINYKSSWKEMIKLEHSLLNTSQVPQLTVK